MSRDSLKPLLRERLREHRVGAVLVGISLAVLVGMSFYAWQDGDTLAVWEVTIFNWVNGWPDWLLPFFIAITNIGTVGAVIIAGLVALIARYRRVGLAVLLSGGIAWFIAHLLKDLIDRARPGGFIEDLVVRYATLSGGYGFPSGHATVAAAVAMALAVVLPRKYALWLALFALSVGLSRLYLGVHLPLDIVGGWCIGIIVGYLVGFALQVERKSSSK